MTNHPPSNKSSLLLHLAIQLLNLDLELGLQRRYMMLILRDLHPHLLPLLLQILNLLLHPVQLNRFLLPTKVLPYLVREMLVQVLRHLQLLLHDLQLVL
jgi:hypothetical protein